MPKSLAYNYIHFVFSTKYRDHFIDVEIEDRLYEYIAGICKNFDSPSLQIGGMPDHIHILLVLSKKFSLVRVVEEIKKNSSKWMKENGEKYSEFYWQTGYGAFSVSPKHIKVVQHYILNQKEHHREKTFKEEYTGFLKNYNIEYDEKHLWD